MKIWQIVKGKGLASSYRVCGYPIYTVTERTNLRERKFCQGLISSKKIFDHDRGIRLKEFLLCGLRISQYGIWEYQFIFRLFGIQLRKEEISLTFYKKYQSKIPTNTDYLFFLITGMGELSLCLSLCLKSFMKQHDICHPLFITNVKYHMSLVNIFWPSLKILYVEDSLFPRWGEFKVNNIRALYLFPTLYFQQVEQNSKTKEVHFFEAILDCLKLSLNNLFINPPKITDKYQQSAKEKLRLMGLTNQKFVFIAPEANSCVEINKSFWYNLVVQIRKKGLEVVFNPMKRPCPADCHMADFTLQEAFVVAQHAHAVIGLRSGLLDLLSMTGTPIHAIYTSFKKRIDFPPMSASHVKKGFDLEKLPKEIRKSKIYSYFYCDSLVDDILRGL